MATTESDDSDDARTDDDSSLTLFAPLSDAAHFDNITNLRALRLPFDISACATQLCVAHYQLSGLRGLQETYDARRRTLWISDALPRPDARQRS